jgi:hypothetical protein
MPCHHNLEQYMAEYLDGLSDSASPKTPLFRTAAGRTGELTGSAMTQSDAYRMIRRRAREAGIRNWQPHLPRNGHHDVLEKRREARGRPADGRA